MKKLYFKYLSLIYCLFTLSSLSAQIDSNRPENTVRYQNIHYVIDQEATNIGESVIEEKHNKSINLLKTILLADLRIRNLYIIPRADNEYVTNISGVPNDANQTLSNFSSWVLDTSNNCDVRDMQAFTTGFGGGTLPGSAAQYAGVAFGDLVSGYSVFSLFNGPREDIVLAHEWAHSVGALEGDHSQGISHFDALQVVDIADGLFTQRITTSTGWGFANNAAPFFSIPIAHNGYDIANGGSGFLTINQFDTNDNFSAHYDIPVKKMDNTNDLVNRIGTINSNSRHILPATQEATFGCGVVEHSLSRRTNMSFDNTSTGIFTHYQNHMNYLREESTGGVPAIPQITVINGKINVTNLSDYNMQFPNTTSATYQNLYFTKGDYEVYVYEATNSNSGAQIAGPITLGQIITNLPNNNYVVRVYERWSNSLSPASNAVTLSIEEQELSNLSIYPNPTSNIVSIQADEILKSIEIYTLLGAKVQTIKSIESNSIDISLNHFSSGIYLLKIYGNRGSSVKRLIKN
ncbi:MAG: T9SS type A sorting domain-containing protein [Flavobacteriaceae bacterium]|nr:MAG: T9SS type A sorting domain-containing protein [Flavobacteriaceae bacterium]